MRCEGSNRDERMALEVIESLEQKLARADARIAELESEVVRLKSKVNATFDAIHEHTSRAAAKRIFAAVKEFDQERAGNGGG